LILLELLFCCRDATRSLEKELFPAFFLPRAGLAPENAHNFSLGEVESGGEVDHMPSGTSTQSGDF
jgi:hypothetical protein